MVYLEFPLWRDVEDGAMAVKVDMRTVALIAALWMASGSAGLAAKDAASVASGLTVPRYVSLKSDHVNVRAGPTKDQDVSCVYTRSGFPVEITSDV